MAVTKALDVWPNLPVSIRLRFDPLNDPGRGDLIAALELRDRIVGIDFSVGLSKYQLERCAALMQEPFPILRTLLLSCFSEDLMSRIDAPLLRCLRLTFLYRPIFGMPQLTRLINGMEKLKSALYASLDSHKDGIDVSM